MRYNTDLIRSPKQQDDVKKFEDGNTQDIIETVLFGDKKAAWYTEKFAPTLKGKKLFETCRNIWEFVKTRIPYVLDKSGYQWIKSPGRLWQEKAGDCKSFSVFTGSCLRNLGIPYGYRFASYSPNDPTPTHVYVFVPLKDGSEIILDSVWQGAFNTQKKYSFKKDYIMPEIHYLGNTGGKQIPGTLRLTKPWDQISDGEMDLLLAKQRLEIEKMNSAHVAGPDNFQQVGYDRAIAVVNHCLRNVDNPDVICGLGDEMEGIGRTRKPGQKKGFGKFLQKLGKGIKKGFKAVTKTVTAPLRLIAKGAMEIYLPKSAIFFLYLFADKPDKLPDVMKLKRKKAEKFKKFVVQKLGMKEKHFDAIIRNNLTKRFHMSPEKFIAKQLGARVSGIGNPNQRYRSWVAGIGGPAYAKKHNPSPVKAKPGWNSTFNCYIGDIDTDNIGAIAGVVEDRIIQQGSQVQYSPKVFSSAAKNLQQMLLNAGISVKIDGYAGQKTSDAYYSVSGKYLSGDSRADQIVDHYSETDASGSETPSESDWVDKLNPKKKTGQLFKKGLQLAKGAGLVVPGGGLVAAAISAISWLIQKLGGKKAGIEKITAKDFPDIERDASNAFDYKDLKENYNNLTDQQRSTVKDKATQLMQSGASDDQIDNTLPDYLSNAQRKEIKYEIKEGPEAIDAKEADALAKNIKKDSSDQKVACCAPSDAAPAAVDETESDNTTTN